MVEKASTLVPMCTSVACRQIPGSGWPATLAELVSPRHVRDPEPKEKGGWLLRGDI